MQQLWLNGKRIDCIDQLRSVLKEADEDEREQLCFKLLEYFNKGVLQAWLSRQARHKMLLVSKEQTTELESAVGRLREAVGVQEMTHELYDALGVLCNVPADSFAGNAKKQAKKDKAAIYKKRWLKEKRYWSEELFQSVADWSWVITTQNELQTAVEEILNRKSDSAVIEMFLCRPDKGSYTINLLNVRNVTIIGVGDPRVRHSNTLQKWEYIDAQKNRLTLKNFTLLCPHRDNLVIGHNDKQNKFRQEKA